MTVAQNETRGELPMERRWGTHLQHPVYWGASGKKMGGVSLHVKKSIGFAMHDGPENKEGQRKRKKLSSTLDRVIRVLNIVQIQEALDAQSERKIKVEYIDELRLLWEIRRLEKRKESFLQN